MTNAVSFSPDGVGHWHPQPAPTRALVSHVA